MLLSRLMTRKLFHKDERWGIAFVAGPWRKASLRKGTQVANLPNRYFADPFVVTLDQRTVVFVEDYNFRKKRGCITAIEIIDDKNYQILGPVIEESFHMSFPYIFQYKDDLYMIPETAESKSIRLYKCVQFPLTWVYQKDILSDLRAADSMMFEHDGKWWLFSNIAPTAESDHESQLFAYYSSYPLSDEWVAHDRNPLLVNSNIGRNGGILDVEANNPIRVRQKQGFDFYGRSLTIAKILELTPSSYKEQEISQVLPKFLSGNWKAVTIFMAMTSTQYTTTSA